MSINTVIIVCVILELFLCNCEPVAKGQPNIVLILADDLGWNDVGFHSSNQIPTPNIDALAYSGLILNNYYVTPICTPSRSALMTGKYPIHTGMQHSVIYGAEPRGLPLSEKILPEYLKDLGYSNHIVGKWHLGHFRKEYLPLNRGFETHLGFWTGHQDYYDHTAVENGVWGLDMRRGMDVAWDLHGKYTTDVITKEAVKIIANHNTSKPLFLYVAHAAVHSSNPYNPLSASDDDVVKFSYIENFKRRKFAAILSKLDESVGEIVRSLSNANMLSNSVIIFSTDNGGPADGFNSNAASNWPLRGVKNTLWEGGVRGAGLIWSPLIKNRQRVASQMMHITDWLPTIYTAAGGDSKNIIKGLDAVDMWKALVEDHPSSRTEILHNIDDIFKTASLTIEKWKIILGSTYKGSWDYWYGPSGRGGSYNISKIINSLSGKAVRKIFNDLNSEIINEMRNAALLNCSNDDAINIACDPQEEPCLFNIKEDPCELKNLANNPEHRETLENLLSVLARYNSTAVPPGNKPLDPRGEPSLWNYTWTDFDEPSYSCQIS